MGINDEVLRKGLVDICVDMQMRVISIRLDESSKPASGIGRLKRTIAVKTRICAKTMTPKTRTLETTYVLDLIPTLCSRFLTAPSLTIS